MKKNSRRTSRRIILLRKVLAKVDLVVMAKVDQVAQVQVDLVVMAKVVQVLQVFQVVQVVMVKVVLVAQAQVQVVIELDLEELLELRENQSSAMMEKTTWEWNCKKLARKAASKKEAAREENSKI